MKDDRDDGFLELIGLLTNVIGNERVRAYNEGLDTEHNRCLNILALHGIAGKSKIVAAIRCGDDHNGERPWFSIVQSAGASRVCANSNATPV